MNIAFIGGGNMATALIGGLQQSAQPPERITVSDPDRAARERLATSHGVECFDAALDAIAEADVVVLAIKPQVMPIVLKELAGRVSRGQLTLSIAAGIPVARIAAALGADRPVVRAMPNTPALIGLGVAGLFAGPGCHARHRRAAEWVLGAAGETEWLDDESLMDVVTAISGSGPAYYFALTEALREAGVASGLPADVAAKLALHTAHGAGAMLARAGLDASELRRRVTSPGGTTEAALATLTAAGFSDLIGQAVAAATRRGRELATTGAGP